MRSISHVRGDGPTLADREKTQKCKQIMIYLARSRSRKYEDCEGKEDTYALDERISNDSSHLSVAFRFIFEAPSQLDITFPYLYILVSQVFKNKNGISEFEILN